MKGDFSRLTFDPKKGYSGVLMQQGRVQLDADWNEQVEITNHRIETETRDLLGRGGAPADDPGFEIRAVSWLSFDGEDDYVLVEDWSDFSFGGRRPFSLEAWVGPRDTGAAATIIGNLDPRAPSGSPAGEYSLDIEPDGSVSLRRLVVTEDENHAGAREEGRAVKELAPCVLRTARGLRFGRASHVAATFDGEEGRIYVNGELVARRRYEERGAHAAAPLLVGAGMSGGEPARFYGGRMDDIRVWDVARTREQIRHDMRRRLEGDEPGLVACWRADAVAGGVVSDLSGHGHDGLSGGGFESGRPSVVSGEVWIGRGRYYADGLLCENAEDVPFTEQPDYPGATLPESGVHLAYLDAWQRFVTAVEDPSIRDAALGGLDTTGRTRVVAQVKLLPLAGRQADTPHKSWQDFTTGRAADKARLRARHQGSAYLPGNQLYRVEVHSGGEVYGGPRADGARVTLRPPNGQGAAGEREVVFADGAGDAVTLRAGEWVEIFAGPRGREEGAGHLAHVTGGPPASEAVTLSVEGVPPDFLDRTDLRLRSIAMIKWSRENGSVVFPVNGVERNVVSLNDLGRDESLLNVDDWVELSDDTHVLQGRPAPFLRVTHISRTPPAVTLHGPPLPDDFDDRATHPQIRRWDAKTINGEPLFGGLIPARSSYGRGHWLNLESGIQISFEAGALVAGDYWLIPSRAETGTVEWPGDEADPSALPPYGVRHHYAPLALLRFEEGAVGAHDYRRIFVPLTELGPGDGDQPFVKKSGDTMSGPLTIEASLHVAEQARARTLHGEEAHVDELRARAAHVETLHAREAHVGELRGRLADDTVGERQLVDRAVTRAKLAEDIGELWSFPSGYSVLGDTPVPPPDFTYTGSHVVAAHRPAAWVTRAEAPLKVGDRLASAAARGRIYSFTDSGAVWEFDPSTNVWRQRALTPQCGPVGGVAAVNDRVYVFYDAGDVWEYDPAAEPQEQAWTQKTSMPTPRRDFGVAAVGGKIYVVGGERRALFGLLRVATKRNEVYDPAADAWERKRGLPVARYAFGVGALNDKLCTVGGMEGFFFGIFRRAARSNEKYDPASGRWSGGLPATPTRRSRAGVGVVDNKVYAVGGRERGRWTAGVEVLEPFTGWAEVTPPRRAVNFPNALTLDGKLYVVGGDPSRPDACVVEEWPVSSVYYVHRKNQTADDGRAG